MKINETISDNAILIEIGERIAQYRLSRNLTQKALSKEAGVSERTVQRAEHGETIQTTSFIRILRVLSLVKNFEALIPKATQSPIDQLKRKGKKRKRASKASNSTRENSQWSWEDER